MDPEAHLQAGILVGDLRWEDREDPGGQDLDQWVLVDLVGQETGDLLTEDLEVQEVQEDGIRVERVVSRATLRRRQREIRARDQQREQRRSRRTCLTSVERCGWRQQLRGARCIITMLPPAPPSGPSLRDQM